MANNAYNTNNANQVPVDAANNQAADLARQITNNTIVQLVLVTTRFS